MSGPGGGAAFEAYPSDFLATISHGRNGMRRAPTCFRPSRDAMRLRGVALNAVSPCITLFPVSRCIAASCASAAKASGSSPISAETGETRFQPLDDRHLGGYAAKDKLPGRIEPLAGQGVDDVVPGARLGLIERLGGSGRPLPGNIGTMEISAAERRGIGCKLPSNPRLIHEPVRLPERSARTPAKNPC